MSWLPCALQLFSPMHLCEGSRGCSVGFTRPPGTRTACPETGRDDNPRRLVPVAAQTLCLGTGMLPPCQLEPWLRSPAVKGRLHTPRATARPSGSAARSLQPQQLCHMNRRGHGRADPASTAMRAVGARSHSKGMENPRWLPWRLQGDPEPEEPSSSLQERDGEEEEG